MESHCASLHYRCRYGEYARRNLSRGTSVAVTTTGANGTTGDIACSASIRGRALHRSHSNAYHSITLGPNATLANNRLAAI